MAKFKAYANSCILVGVVTREPMFKPAGSTVLLQFDLGWSKRTKGKGGQAYEKKHYQRCIVWGKFAEIMRENVSKGSNVFVQGYLTTNSWNDKSTGAKRYASQLEVQEMQVLDPGDNVPAGTEDDSFDAETFEAADDIQL